MTALQKLTLCIPLILAGCVMAPPSGYQGNLPPESGYGRGYGHGHGYGYGGNPQYELNRLNSLIGRYPTNPDLYAQRAYVYDRMGNYQAAYDNLDLSCRRQRDSDLRQMCYREKSDYARRHHINDLSWLD